VAAFPLMSDRGATVQGPQRPLAAWNAMAPLAMIRTRRRPCPEELRPELATTAERNLCA
jgi:hypothetical protein